MNNMKTIQRPKVVWDIRRLMWINVRYIKIKILSSVKNYQVLQIFTQKYVLKYFWMVENLKSPAGFPNGIRTRDVQIHSEPSNQLRYALKIWWKEIVYKFELFCVLVYFDIYSTSQHGCVPYHLKAYLCVVVAVLDIILFHITEPDITAVTVQQVGARKDCADFCNLFVGGNVFLDIDSSFNVTTGVFTVKRSDTYVISANFLGMQVDTTYQIVVNGEVVDTLLSDGPDNDFFINDSKVVMVKRLWEGDRVEFRMKGRSFFHTLISIWTLTAWVEFRDVTSEWTTMTL